MSSHDKDHAKMSYEEFCASGYNYLFVELLRRGWTEKKLAKAYDSAIAAWQQDRFEGKPPRSLTGVRMRKFCLGDNGRRSAESDKIFSGL
jgi:hypothetical protein